MLKLTPVSERSLISRLESFGHKSTPSDRPWIEAYCPKFKLAREWAGPRMLKVNFLEYLGQGTLGCHSLSSVLFGHFSSPTNIPTHCS